MGFKLGSAKTSDCCCLLAIALAGLQRPNLQLYDPGQMAVSCSIEQVAAGLRQHGRQTSRLRQPRLHLAERRAAYLVSATIRQAKQVDYELQAEPIGQQVVTFGVQAAKLVKLAGFGVASCQFYIIFHDCIGQKPS